jgi:hypothetical protein
MYSLPPFYKKFGFVFNKDENEILTTKAQRGMEE